MRRDLSIAALRRAARTACLAAASVLAAIALGGDAGADRTGAISTAAASLACTGAERPTGPGGGYGCADSIATPSIATAPARQIAAAVPQAAGAAAMIAAKPQTPSPFAPLTDPCIADAAAAYSVGEPALRMILKTEGGSIGACTAWPNGKHDCGPAQVNAEDRVPHMAQLLERPSEVLHAVRDNGCFNIFAAAYILRLKIDEAGGDFWDGMGRYNTAEPVRKQAYQAKLIRAYKELYVPGAAEPPPQIGDGRFNPAEIPAFKAASTSKRIHKVTVVRGDTVTTE